MRQVVLIHIDASLGPVGAWGYHHGTLRHFYPESLDPFIPSRAREVMAARDTDVEQWFHLIASTEPTMLDEYRVIEAEDHEPLVTILSTFRRAWNAADNSS